MSDDTAEARLRFGAMQGILNRPARGAIQTAAELGFDGLELGPGSPDADEGTFWTAEGRAELAALATDMGIELPSVVLGFLNHGTVTAEDPSVRDDAADAIRQGIDAAADLGTSVVLLPFFTEAEITDAAHRERLVDQIGPLADAAEDAGVTLALENTLSAEENHELLETIDSPAVGVYYDVSNATWWGHDPVEELRRYHEDVAQVHFKDGDGSHSNAPLGTGHVDFQGVRDALYSVDYEGWIVLESTTEDDPLADAERNLRFSRNLMRI
jgi:sugar phosphate isomerase/epimerase